MKNKIHKARKTKLIARVMLVVILVASALFLSSCFKRFYIANYHLKYYSHSEFVEFVEQYGAKKQEIFVPTFISFDLDDVDNVDVDLYDVWTTHEVTRSLITKKEERENIFGETHKERFRCVITFFMDDYTENGELIEKAHKITCTYGTRNYNFNYEDPIRIELHYISHEFADFHIYVNDILEVDVFIQSYVERPPEKIDNIGKLLMDNIVIINRGDSK